MPEVDQYWRDDRSVGLADGRANGTPRDLLPLGEGDQVLVEPADFLRDVPREPQHLGGRVTRHELRLSIGVQARGKQATRYANHDCLYTRTTGIWQTVWLEAVPPVHLRRPRITPGRGRFGVPPDCAAVGEPPRLEGARDPCQRQRRGSARRRPG